MKKSTKRFVISSERKNNLEMRVRTAGIELADFEKNPLLLWMHRRPKGESADEILPLGYWEDIERKDGKITGVPVFDEDDAFAMKIYKKVENGTIKMASAGLKPLQFTEEDGEEWLERSVLVEGSLCDIGSNGDALAVALYNEDEELITLADFTHRKKQKTDRNMKLIQLSEPTAALLKLAEGSTEADAHKAILNLVTLSDSQKAEIDTLKADKKKLQEDLDEQVKLADSAELIALVDTSIAERKITADQKEDFLKLSLESAKGILGKMKAAPTVASKLNTGGKNTDELMKLSYDELHKSGQLITLKENNLDGFKEKFQEKFNKEYEG